MNLSKQISFICFIFILSSCGKPTEEILQEELDVFITQIQNKKGVAAAKKLDRKTLDWFGTILNKAKKDSPYRLGRANYFTKLYVLLLRQNFSKMEIDQMTKEQVFAFLAFEDIIEKVFIGEIETEKISIAEDESSAVMVLRLRKNRTIGKAYIKMIKIGDEWKINLATLMNILNRLNTSWRLKEIPNENDRVEQQVVSISQMPLKENIWKPTSLWVE